VWLVHNLRDEYEAFIIVHLTEWLRYHRRLFDELLASVDRRRAMMIGPDPLLTAERVYYVQQRAYVDQTIRRLEGWLLVAHQSLACPFCRDVLSLGLPSYVVEDSQHSPIQHDQIDGPGQGYYRQEGPEDMRPGNNKAPEDEEDPESATSGRTGQAEEGHAISGPVTDSGPSQSPLTESRPAWGPAEDGLEGGAHAARRWEEECGGGGESRRNRQMSRPGPARASRSPSPKT
jgi:hypothetical protein